MPTLIICEKATQAENLRKALGSSHGKIVPASGHLLELLPPEAVREEWQKWSATLLWPGRFYPKRAKNEDRARRLLSTLNEAIKGCDRVIIATDCDREGQVIGQELTEHFNFKGSVLRAMFNAEDPKSLRKAFDELTPITNWAGLYNAGLAREQADQIANLSLTRTFTTLFQEEGRRTAIGIGRVKTPVLAIICKREEEIQNFRSQDMFEVDVTAQVAAGPFKLTLNKMPATLLKEAVASEEEQEEAEAEDSEGLEEDEDALKAAENTSDRIFKREIAEGVLAAAKGFSGPVSLKKRQKSSAPPKLFDLVGVQSACNARFGWDAEKTLKVAQSLYSERSIITYPRAESTYLPEANIPEVPALLAGLLPLPAYGGYRELLARPNVRKGKAGHFSDAGLAGSPHYAIIPNVNEAANFATIVPQLSADEARLFDLVARQYLAAMAPDFLYNQTDVSMLVPWQGHNWNFRNSGRVPLSLGWREILGGGGQVGAGEELFPQMANGDPARILDGAIRVVKTKAPSRYTEGALIKVMKQAWRLVSDPQLREMLKTASGIGTPATRARILAGLKDQGQITTSGKTLRPTPGGMMIYTMLKQVAPNVIDPARTAQWEMMFSYIERGQMTAEDAVKRVLAETQREIDRIVEAAANSNRIAVGRAPKPTPKMVDLAKMIAERKGIKPPAGYLTDAAKCRAFLEEHLPKRDPNAPAPAAAAPSENALAFAERLSEQLGKPIPAEARANQRTLMQWIDTAKKAVPPRPPTEKMIAFAQKIASEKGIELPAKVQTDGEECSKFISKHKSADPAKRKA